MLFFDANTYFFAIIIVRFINLAQYLVKLHRKYQNGKDLSLKENSCKNLLICPLRFNSSENK